MNDGSENRTQASTDEVLCALKMSPLFRGVGPEAIGVYLESCTVWIVPEGTTFITPETNEKSLYIILKGSVFVRLENSDEAPLTELVQGQCVGEMSIIDSAPPSAYVSAARNCKLLIIDHQTVWRLINGSHGIARNLLEVLSQRLRFDNEHIVDKSEIVEQSRRNAITDSLTDLHNRYWMQVMFARKIERAQETNEGACLAVLDLDRFKQFNDRHGHQKGDMLLQQVAGALRDLFRPTDLIARFGGDEFAVLLPGTGLDQATSIGMRVRSGIVKRTASIAQSASDVTVSIGIAVMNQDDTLETLLERADEALYRAKDKGRNQVSS